MPQKTRIPHSLGPTRSRLKRAAKAAAPAPLTLAQQQADFTAEGSPPPGKVASAVPEGIETPVDPDLPVRQG